MPPKWVLKQVTQVLSSPTTPGTGKSERSVHTVDSLAFEIPTKSLINLLRWVEVRGAVKKTVESVQSNASFWGWIDTPSSQ